MKRKLISLFISVALILSFAPAAFAANFSGYSEWAYAELTEAEEYGLIADSIRAQMNAPITRKEFAELAVRLVEVYTGKTPMAAPKETFSDTTNEYVLKAYTCGIVNGVGEGRFEPESLTNREQVATMLGRTMQLIAPEMDTTYSDETNFSDEDQVAEYFLPYVKFMSQRGFIKGSGGQFHPKDTCTREQAVLIVKRVYEYLILSLLNELGDLPENGGKTDSQAAPQDGQSIVGSWTDSSSGYDEYSHGNLINSYYSGEVYIFNADGTFRNAIGGSLPTMSGIVVWDGSYSVSGGTIYLTQIKQSWQPWPDDRSGGPAYTGKAVRDTALRFEFLDEDTLAICTEGSSAAFNYHRVKK